MFSISVIITCYNEENFIADAIDSVLSQTAFDHIKEIFIIDDGSTDNSKSIIYNYINQSERIQYIYQENAGLAEARNTGIKRCTGEWIALLDGDDAWLPNKLKEQIKVIEKYPDVGIVYSDCLKAPDGLLIQVNSYKYTDGIIQSKFFINDGPIFPSTALINFQCFLQLGLFDPNLKKAQDTDMWIRITGMFRIHHISKPLIKRLDNPNSLSSNFDSKFKYLLSVIEKSTQNYRHLKQYKKNKLSLLHFRYSKKLLLKGYNKQAFSELMKSVKYNPLNFKYYFLFLFTFIPYSYFLFFKSKQYLKKLFNLSFKHYCLG